MAYIVTGQTGSRKNKTFTRISSIPLPNKERVRAYLNRSPLGNSKTKFTVKNTRTKKTYEGTRINLIYGSKSPFMKKLKFS